MTSNFWDSVVLITSQDEEEYGFGTGFVIYRDFNSTYLLTCAHVVRDVGGPEQVKAAGIPARAIASGTPEGFDLAVLRVEGLLDKPLLKLSGAGQPASRWIVPGFYSNDRTKTKRLVSLEGELGSSGPIQEGGARANAWDLKIDDGSDHFLQPGYSGSPAIDRSSGRVFGVVVQRQDNGKRGLAISLEALPKIWLQMPAELLEETNMVRTRLETRTVAKASPIEIFFSYADKDVNMQKELEDHLSILRRSNAISISNRRAIGAGKEWQGEIDKHLNEASIILLLVSPDFLASDYCWDVEVMRAMKRHKSGEARVIPVLLRPIEDWRGVPFSMLQPLPLNSRPVTQWGNRDEAFASIAQGIRTVVEELTQVA